LQALFAALRGDDDITADAARGLGFSRLLLSGGRHGK
jgi:hypothetical protein